MYKRLLAATLAAFMGASMIISAGAQFNIPLQSSGAVNPAVATALETALSQPMDDASYAQIMQNDALFEQVLLDEQVVTNEDGTQGIVRTYEFVPKFETRGASVTSYPMVEWISTYDKNSYVRLYTTFTHNGTSVSCIEKSVTYNWPDFEQTSLTVKGNGTNKASATLDFKCNTGLGLKSKRLAVACDKNGSITNTIPAN